MRADERGRVRWQSGAHGVGTVARVAFPRGVVWVSVGRGSVLFDGYDGTWESFGWYGQTDVAKTSVRDAAAVACLFDFTV